MKRRRTGKKGRTNFHIFNGFFLQENILHPRLLFFRTGREDLYQQGSEMDELIQIKRFRASIEERRLEIEERKAGALERIASALEKKNR